MSLQNKTNPPKNDAGENMMFVTVTVASFCFFIQCPTENDLKSQKRLEKKKTGEKVEPLFF